MGILIILFILSIILCIIGCTNIYKKTEYNKNIAHQNTELKRNNEYLKTEQELEQIKLKSLKEKISELNNTLNNINQNYENNAKQAFQNYCELLNNEYDKKENEYKTLEEKLQNNYNIAQEKALKELKTIEEELNKIKATRKAAIQAQLKEKEIKEAKDFYSLTISETDLFDIKALERVKKQLHQPRILSMLIWKTYYQKPMTDLCNNVLGTTVKTGIYKITNQLNDCCYIGQSVDVSARWKEHAKCGLEIDTPPANKLYKAMIEDGLYNFSFELLEECSKDLLNEKERFYIELYQSDKFGYNNNKGITK